MGLAEMMGLGDLVKRKKQLEDGASSIGLGSVPVKDKVSDEQKAAIKVAETPKVDANQSVTAAPETKKKWKRLTPEEYKAMQEKYGK